MTNSDLCFTVNTLSKALCDLKKNNDTNALKYQLQFNTDFYANRRMITMSFLTFEYSTNCHVYISKDELDIIREFLLTYMEKFTNPNLSDVFISFCNCCLKISFVSYERTSATNDTCQVIQEIENEITRLYENNIFKILSDFLNNIQIENSVQKIKCLHKYFNSGTYYTKCNVNMLVNRSELEKICLNWNKCNNNPYYAEPAEPAEPYGPEPFEPSEPSDFYPVISKMATNVNLGINKQTSDEEIKNAIARILEVSTTGETTQI
jgi:hypothetical protein